VTQPKNYKTLVNDDKHAVGSDPGASWKATTSDGRCIIIPRELLIPRNTQPAAPASIDTILRELADAPLSISD
jgi:hypothetical protein